MAIPTLSEDELGNRWDRCLVDAMLKLGGGVLVGGLTSVVLFKRRRWPILLGTGFGIGLAYGNCERELKDVLTTSISEKV